MASELELSKYGSLTGLEAGSGKGDRNPQGESCEPHDKYVRCCIPFECKTTKNAIYKLMSEDKRNEIENAGGLITYEIG